MARTADPQKAAAIADLLKHMEIGADSQLVRIKYHSVTRSTWSRWLIEAREEHTRRHGSAPISGHQTERPKIAPPPAKSLPPQKGPKRAKKQRPTCINDPEDGAPPMPEGAERCGDGFLDADGEVYSVMTMFGVRETSVVGRFTGSPELDPHQALRILDRMSEQYLNAEALMRACIKRAGEGHVILDPKAYGTAVDLQRRTLMDMLTILERSRNLDSLESFMQAVVQRIQGERPEIALPLIRALREAAQPFTARQWQSQPLPT